MEVSNIMVYLACICFLFIFGKIFIIPLKLILKLIFNSILGGVLILIINLIGMSFSFHIGLNILTSLIIGILGIPRSYFTYNFKYIFISILNIANE